MDIRRNFFMQQVVKLWGRLPRALVESPCLEVFQRCVDVAPRDTSRDEGSAMGLSKAG